MARFLLAAGEPRRLLVGERWVDYVLVRRRGRRGVGLRVDVTGLTVSAPLTFPVARVEAAIRESEGWVLRKLAEWSGRQVPVVRWSDGERLPYLGRGLVLRLGARDARLAERDGDCLLVPLPPGAPGETIRDAVVAWYKRAARAYLAPRVEELAGRAGLPPPRLFISPAMARWGSCNTRREVRLAWRLVKAPPPLIDYVVCHELAHLRHMDHSPRFWAEVERQCPDYRARREALHATDHLYRSF